MGITEPEEPTLQKKIYFSDFLFSIAVHSSFLLELELGDMPAITNS